MTADKMRWLVASIVLLVVLPVLLIANLAASSVRGSTISSPLASSTDCFPAFGKGTGKWFTDQHRLLQRNFLDYWSTPNPNHAAWLGTPVSDELFERTEATGAGGQPFRMQYFSNAVMEYHPELPTPAVQLSLLGQFRYKEKYAGATPIETPPTTTATPFPATGKHITGIFNTYWKNNGDVERFGLPITEKIKERVPGDPTPRTTQYFERAELYIDSSQKVRQVPLGELRYQSKYPGTDFQMLVPTPKATSTVGTFMGCGRGGTGGDSDLNKQKNRIDGVPNGNDPMWHNVSLQSLLDLSWPSSIEGSTPLDTKPRGVWTSVEKSYIAQYEGVPVQVEGWLLGAKQEGQESTNCNATPSTQPERVDYHLWIVDAPGKIKQQSMVIEITPRLRINHSSGGWDIAKICGIINRAATPTPSPSHPYVRISGWLMMDEAHRDQLGQHRASLWEIHPILAFDVWNGTTWVPLDSVP